MIVEFSNPIIVEQESLGKVYKFTATIGQHFYDNCTIINAAVIHSCDYTDRFTFPSANKRIAFVDFTQDGYTYDSPFIHTDTTEGYYDGKSITIWIPVPKDCKEIPVVYIKCDGNVAPDCPCGEDKLIDCIPCINWDKIYTRGLMVLGEPNCNCDIPQLFVDYVILYNGIKTSFFTKRFTKLFELYSRLFNPVIGVASKTCNCHV